MGTRWGEKHARAEASLVPDQTPKQAWRRAIRFPKCWDEAGNSKKHSRTALTSHGLFSLRGCTTSLGDFDRDFGRACGSPPNPCASGIWILHWVRKDLQELQPGPFPGSSLGYVPCATWWPPARALRIASRNLTPGSLPAFPTRMITPESDLWLV